MQFKKFENSFLLKIEPDEPVMESIEQFAKKEGTGFATIMGLGAVKNVELGFYHLHKKSYDRIRLEDDFELASLNGNLSWLNNAPLAHCHVVLGDTHFNAKAGHLFEALSAVTVELWLITYPNPVQRALEPQIGLNLLQLDRCSL